MSKAYYDANHTAVRAQQAAYRADRAADDARLEDHQAKRRAYYLANREQIIANNTASALRRKNDPATAKAYQDMKRRIEYRNKYGISIEDYQQMLVEQDGGCAICLSKNPGGTKTAFFIDHDHETGAVRGLLCSKCNSMLGLANENVDRLVAAAAYLMQYSDILGVSVKSDIKGEML